MGNALKKRQDKLKQRIRAYEIIGESDEGYKRPGSLNNHKQHGGAHTLAGRKR